MQCTTFDVLLGGLTPGLRLARRLALSHMHGVPKQTLPKQALLCRASAVPPELAEPAFAARSAFLGSAGYWAAVHVFSALTPAEGRALVITAAVGHGLLVDLFGWHFDFTHPLAWAAHSLTNVPMPKGQPRGGELSVGAAHPADSSRRRAPVLESKKGR